MYGEDVDDAKETGPGINGCAPSGPLSTKQMTDDAEGRQSRSRFKISRRVANGDGTLGSLVGRIHDTIWNGLFVILVMACLPEYMKRASVISPIM